jgi:hypothetical protein
MKRDVAESSTISILLFFTRFLVVARFAITDIYTGILQKSSNKTMGVKQRIYLYFAGGCRRDFNANF